jgi:hypothetical protein
LYPTEKFATMTKSNKGDKVDPPRVQEEMFSLLHQLEVWQNGFWQ